MKPPSIERGCVGKMKLKGNPANKARAMSEKHGKRYGVYDCPHCKYYHLTTKLENKGLYNGLVYITPS